MARRIGRLETSNGERVTGITDAVYNLTSVLYHTAEGGRGYAKYIEDAQREGDTELSEFFREVQEQDAERAQRAKSLLEQRKPLGRGRASGSRPLAHRRNPTGRPSCSGEDAILR